MSLCHIASHKSLDYLKHFLSHNNLIPCLNKHPFPPDKVKRRLTENAVRCKFARQLLILQ